MHRGNITTQEDFENDTMLSDACIFNLSQIGEKTSKIPKELQERYPQIPWIEISGLRNRLVHDYFGINRQVIWETIIEDLPQLQKNLEKIEASLKKELGLCQERFFDDNEKLSGINKNSKASGWDFNREAKKSG